VLIQVLLVGH
jgi:hypothetical protein